MKQEDRLTKQKEEILLMIKGSKGDYSPKFYFVDDFGFIYFEKGGDSVERIYVDTVIYAPVLH